MPVMRENRMLGNPESITFMSTLKIHKPTVVTGTTCDPHSPDSARYKIESKIESSQPGFRTFTTPNPIKISYNN